MLGRIDKEKGATREKDATNGRGDDQHQAHNHVRDEGGDIYMGRATKTRLEKIPEDTSISVIMGRLAIEETTTEKSEIVGIGLALDHLCTIVTAVIETGTQDDT